VFRDSVQADWQSAADWQSDPRTLLRLICLALLFACASAFAQSQKPYVVLVSLDGFRYDYAEKYQAKNILAIRDAGSSAKALIPCFPSVTFSNHLSIITGLYPEHHGIVMNHFYDPARNAEYSNSKTAPDGSWYSGKPLWVLAEQQKVKAASMFWPASDAEIEGIRPSYWFPYDGSVPDEKRVQQVLDWLKLPEAERPHFITLYFSDVDTAGHNYGPDSDQARQAVGVVDAMVGHLWQGIQETSLPVDLIVVSDHGMQAVSGTINLSDYADLSKVRVINEGPFALIYGRDPKIYNALKGKNPDFDVWWRNETPKRLHYRENPRSGDILVLMNKPKALINDPPPRTLNPGRHGYDPARFETMRGIFYAIGPNVRTRTQIEPFVNINIYPLIAEILGLKITAPIDGSIKVLQPIYRP
jgi:alkaline phosphatase D